MIKMAAILKFKMEDEGVAGKNGTCIGFSVPLLITKSEKNPFWHAYRAEPNT